MQRMDERLVLRLKRGDESRELACWKNARLIREERVGHCSMAYLGPLLGTAMPPNVPAHAAGTGSSRPLVMQPDGWALTESCARQTSGPSISCPMAWVHPEVGFDSIVPGIVVKRPTIYPPAI